MTSAKLRDVRSISTLFFGRTSIVARSETPALLKTFFKALNKLLVLPSEESILSTTTKQLFCTLSLKAMNKALRALFLFIFKDQLRSAFGPKVIPPPGHKGERIEP